MMKLMAELMESGGWVECKRKGGRVCGGVRDSLSRREIGVTLQADLARQGRGECVCVCGVGERAGASDFWELSRAPGVHFCLP